MAEQNTRRHGPRGPHGGMAPGEKAKDFKGTMKKLMTYIGKYKFAVATVIVFAIGSTIFSIIGPKILSKATTELFNGLVAKIKGTGGIDFDKIGKILLILLTMYLVSAVFSFIQGWIMTDLNEKIPLILDGGSVGIGIESTIIDLTEETPMILRPGYITQEMLEEVIGEVHVDPGLIASDSLQKPKAPGMKYRHYAPKADLTVVTGEKKDVIGTINYLSHTGISQGKKIGIIATDETAGEYRCGDVISIGAREDEDAIARHLYGILRKFDDLDVDTIYSESFESEGLGQAIMNRLLKAAGHHVLQAVQEKKMKAYDRIIFAEDGGTCRAPMAAGILEEQILNRPVEVLSRGLVVLFPEPLNQKAEAVMISNGLKSEGFMSEQITEEDITDNTLILTMSEESRQKIFELFPNVEKEDVAVLTEFVGDELEILNPYGGNLQAYGICYETLNKSIKKLVKILNEGEEKCQK